MNNNTKKMADQAQRRDREHWTYILVMHVK